MSPTGCISDLIVDGPLPAVRIIDLGVGLGARLAPIHRRGEAVGALSTRSVYVDSAGDVILLDAAWARLGASTDADLFALGTILFAMATGTAPYGSGQPAPASPVALNPRLPSGLVQVINRAICPPPEPRFASVLELQGALEEVRRAPGSLESLLPAQHISSTAAVVPPPKDRLAVEDDEAPNELEVSEGEDVD